MYLIEAAAVLTGRKGESIPRGSVLIDGDKIVAVGARGEVAIPQGAEVEVIDMTQHTVMPGMIDAHVHLGFDGSADPVARMKEDTDQQLLLRMANHARILFRSGVTTARELGARAFLDLAIKEAIEVGYAIGPHLLVSNRPITSTGGHCWFMGCECDDKVAVRKAAREHVKAGADLIKIMSTGGFMTKGSAPWFSQFDLSEVQAAVDEAHRLGKRISSHAHGTEGIRNSVTAGVDTIEHCSWVTAAGFEYDRATTEQIVEKGIYVCATTNVGWKRMAQMQGPERMKQRTQQIQSMREMGVKFIAGTDAGINNVGFDKFVDGLEVLADLGFTNAEVIESATSLAAEACGIAETTGSLDAGKRADLIAVTGNPLQDLGALRRVEWIIKSGKRYKPEWI